MNDLLFIAEIGSNWFGSVEIAKYLMDEAKESGANFVKMQLFKADDLYDKSWEFYEHAKLCELSYDTARELKAYAESIGLGWFASVTTREDVNFMLEEKCEYIKIRQNLSWEIMGYAIDQMDDTGNGPWAQLIISCPDKFNHIHTSYHNIYTTSKYPSEWKDIDFEAFRNWHCEGFSDHTQGIQASLCAAMYENIRIFEFHFCSDLSKFQIDETKTPDFCVSKYPDAVKELIEKIKHIKGK